GQRLAGRLQRSLRHAIDRRDLRAVKHRHALEQHARLVVPSGSLGLALFDRHRGNDPDRLLALAHAIAELQPRPEAGHERGIRAGERDEQLVVERQPGQSALRPDADPPLPALAGEQLLGGLLEMFAVTLATLRTLAV